MLNAVTSTWKRLLDKLPVRANRWTAAGLQHIPLADQRPLAIWEDEGGKTMVPSSAGKT